MTEQNGRAGMSRRDVLKGAGAGAGVMAVGAAPLASRTGLTERLAAAQGGASTDALQLARVWFDRGRQEVLAGFDDTHRVFDDGSIEILLWPGDLARLKETGLRFEITEVDLVARDRARAATAASVIRTVPPQPGETSTGDYRHLPDFEADLRKLATDNPGIARLIELPYTTLQGRTVYGIEIAEDVNRRDGRPVFYNDGVHHAREWPAAEMPIMWAYDLIEGYHSGDDRIRNIVANVRNVIIPVVNPDGYHHSREFPVDDGAGVSGKPLLGGNGVNAVTGYGQYVRKNRRSYLGTHVGDGLLVEREKPHGDKNWDVYGVDPNRNYAYAWGDDTGGSSSDQTSQTYRGERPLSEAESKNVAHIFTTRQVTGMITHHTSGDLVLWAWGDTRTNAPDNTLLEGIGRGCAQYNGYTPQKSIDLYVTTGTTSDYAYGSLGSIGYTFEHAGDSFHPEYTSTVPAMYEKNREALILLVEQMCLRPGDRKSAPPADMVASFESLNAAAAAKGEPVVPLGSLNHCILRGRLVDAANEGVPGEVKLFKRFRTPLWQFFYSDGVIHVGENPSGMQFWEEIVETVAQTAPDGSFELHCNPSTRPAMFADGGRETWEFTARGNGGGHYEDIYIERGEERDLGDLQVG